MRDLVAAKRLMAELGKCIDCELVNVHYVSKVWEDNNNTQNLAYSKGPPMMSRTKHMVIEYHWFRSMIGSNIGILCIDTKEQCANIFTEGLARFAFEQERKRVIGW